MWGNTTCLRVWPQKTRYVAGSRRFGRGGQVGRTPRGRAASRSKVGQSDFVPCARRIFAIWRKHSCLSSRGWLPMGARFAFSLSLLDYIRKNMQENRGRGRDTRESRGPPRYQIRTSLPRSQHRIPSVACTCKLNSSASRAILSPSRLRL